MKLQPIATVKNLQIEAIDDHWESNVAEIELADHIPTEAFKNISNFSHLKIIYYFGKVKTENIVFSGRPRENLNSPLVGIFGQRKKDWPNQIVLCTAVLLEHDERLLKVKYLDAINRKPILEIEPAFKEFQPRGEINRPVWVVDLMKNY